MVVLLKEKNKATIQKTLKNEKGKPTPKKPSKPSIRHRGTISTFKNSNKLQVPLISYDINLSTAISDLITVFESAICKTFSIT